MLGTFWNTPGKHLLRSKLSRLFWDKDLKTCYYLLSKVGSLICSGSSSVILVFAWNSNNLFGVFAFSVSETSLHFRFDVWMLLCILDQIESQALRISLEWVHDWWFFPPNQEKRWVATLQMPGIARVMLTWSALLKNGKATHDAKALKLYWPYSFHLAWTGLPWHFHLNFGPQAPSKCDFNWEPAARIMFHWQWGRHVKLLAEW